ncbi:MAG: hypothetical protein A2509_06015 [Candidatus Edwardsbacteria bacterium RIFOXYD12_FULL_50_11]|uniref:histidine kinase n=1 Tax=Candidatus Edwardsbacteria bacterium GWF2_54_11 TaxID=1817851 RepID=A0A1F5R312_9BACT|nr:MAG: hypothetical protein A2502_10600 [Candidatus Edwardsbacteria bacterium RifOxyC12_full_54_24]OGF06720.1 MAG: hypothetical protein A2273_00465 [Candidatus Edwardsbacteria bacterium RifOxyA12_full_54_48]OGF08789.1 MAG: hypothetical protein A2024_00720 [Candidatus Edwardsbacteria bacterium GWF2_54_11]OGF10671.1 MAG: hypothetical protein A3K15_05830 [Candidatus Edwardsbacteria bacterium GWE2_54_12]OGF15452.1 MAG: hypothetical protein A2509_06015 [Candidatus Edwardsbacteria bacterium RIFOXYD1
MKGKTEKQMAVDSADKQALTLLKDSETRYRRLFETAQDGILILNADTGVIENANPFIKDLLGYPREELLGKVLWEIGLFKDIAASRDSFIELQKKGYVRYEDLPLETKDGRRKEVEFVSNAYSVGGKNVLQCNIRDITERKEIEAGLEKTRKELAVIKKTADEVSEFAESVINTVRESLISLDQNLRVVTVSRSFYEVFKVKPDETVGQLIYDLGNKQWDIPKLRELLETILPQKASFENYEVEHNFATIGRRIMLLNARQIKRSSGKERIILLAIEDITERKQAEASVRESEKRLNRAQEIAHLGSWEFDLVNDRLFWSDELYRIFGLKSQAFAATYEAFLDQVHPDDRAEVDAAHSGSKREGKDVYEIDHRIIRKSTGEVRNVHEKCEHIRDETGRLIRTTAMVHDITERKQVDDELERSNQSLEQFAYVASHDLQEPLRVMSNYSQLLEKRYKGKLDADADDFIGFIVNAASRMQKLISDLLEYSRIGRKENPLTEVDSNELVDKAIKNLSGSIKSAGATVTHGNLPVVNVPANSFMQLFQNLIGNAVKFHGQEPPRITISAEKQDIEWKFGVHDNGIGIEPQYQDRILQIFQRLHSLHEYPGTGIGLAICKKIVENRGGRIWVESQAGQGATFYFTVPVLFTGAI